MRTGTPLPQFFCWSKFGTEAGQTVEQILERKEEERRRNDGVFLWGIGNSVGNAVTELVHRSSRPEVLFSPIKVTARGCDREPGEVLAWRSAETSAGDEFALPTWSLVTSKQDRERPKLTHYALVCYSDAPLELGLSCPHLDFAYLKNLATGHRLGASQVTAVVERARHPIGAHRMYPVAFRATLVAPFFVRLRNPVSIPPRQDSPGWQDAVLAFWTEHAEKPQVGRS